MKLRTVHNLINSNLLDADIIGGSHGTPSFYVVSLLYSLGFNQKVNMKEVGYKLLHTHIPARLFT